IHIRLGARSGLPHDQREVVVELAIDYLLRGLDDGTAEHGVEAAEVHVHFRRGTLDDAERTDDRLRLSFLTDPEIVERTLCLGPPVAVGGDFDRSESIGLGTCLGHRAILVLSDGLCRARPSSTWRRATGAQGLHWGGGRSPCAPDLPE